jgi:hypothetical protein
MFHQLSSELVLGTAESLKGLYLLVTQSVYVFELIGWDHTDL